MKETFTIWDFFVMGGPVMWILAMFSLVVLAIIFERLIFFVTADLKTDDITEKICKATVENNMENIDEICRIADKKLCGAVFLKLFESVSSKGTVSLDAVEAAISKCSEKTEKHLGILSGVGTIAPITGFLGTVTGMIHTFMNIAKADDISVQLAASGIFEALITTAYGLIVALVAIVFYHVFTGISDKFVFSLENNCKLIIAAYSDRKI